MNGTGYIYKITNRINGKIYVGKTKTTIKNRWCTHISAYKKYVQSNKNSSKLYNAINKYGIENFNISQLDECSYSELNDKERYWISKLDARNPDVGYNICRGGECGPGGPMFAGHKHSSETRAKMSINRVGNNNSNYGNHRVMPNDEKMKHAVYGSKNGMFNKHHTEESNQKNREKHIGKIWMTNGNTDVCIKKEDEKTYVLAGYHRGRTFANGRKS